MSIRVVRVRARVRVRACVRRVCVPRMTAMSGGLLAKIVYHQSASLKQISKKRTHMINRSGSCRVRDGVGSRTVPVSVPVSVMTMAIMPVSALAPATVVRAGHSQVLNTWRRRYIGVTVCWARGIDMTSRTSAPKRGPVGVTTMTMVRVRRSCVANRLMGGVRRSWEVVGHGPQMVCYLVVERKIYGG